MDQIKDIHANDLQQEDKKAGDVKDVGQSIKVQVPEEYRTAVEKLVDEYRDIFADLELGKTDVVKMHLDTGDHPPIRLQPYRTALKERAHLEDAITKLLTANLIMPSHSQWAFPLVIVPKKDGS